MYFITIKKKKNPNETEQPFGCTNKKTVEVDMLFATWT